MKCKFMSALMAFVILFSSIPVKAEEQPVEETWNETEEIIEETVIEDLQEEPVSEEWMYTVSDEQVTITGYNGELTEIIIPETIEEYPVTGIGASAFRNCKNLTVITIPDSVLTIGANAFKDCELLKVINLPVNLKSIGAGALEGCATITSLVILDSVEQIPDRLCSGCVTLNSLVMPEGIKKIGSSAFNGCSALTGISIPENVSSIGSSAFYKCSSLTEISIPDGVTEIGDYVFGYCTKLANISIPSGVSRIGIGAFQNDSSLKQIEIPESVKTIDSFAFKNCTSLSEMTIPGSVSALGWESFKGCSNLFSVNILDGVGSVDANAFENCTKLNAIIIPETVKTIGTSAYKNTSLKDVYYTSTEEDWKKINIKSNNDPLLKATMHYDYDMSFIGFSDVTDPTLSYYRPVYWAVENDITKGTGENKFSPGNTCTRGQFVTFLWRTMGCPEPESDVNPFDDVPSAASFYKAVLWAVEQGVTKGKSDTKFAPYDTVTRAQVATFLYRAEKSPSVSGMENPFTDVPKGLSYSDAVIWAADKGVTTGTDAMHFRPGNTCTRAQAVTFLWRLYSGEFKK
ncbi:MAG: leucine-rich repeat protein [Solobacterium sp.]|nr:leucine-rich repeat protein [Solobacterium sp.]